MSEHTENLRKCCVYLGSFYSGDDKLTKLFGDLVDSSAYFRGLEAKIAELQERERKYIGQYGELTMSDEELKGNQNG